MLALFAEFICFPEWLWIGIGVTTGYLPKSVLRLLLYVLTLTSVFSCIPL